MSSRPPIDNPCTSVTSKLLTHCEEGKGAGSHPTFILHGIILHGVILHGVILHGVILYSHFPAFTSSHPIESSHQLFYASSCNSGANSLPHISEAPMLQNHCNVRASHSTSLFPLSPPIRQSRCFIHSPLSILYI